MCWTELRKPILRTVDKNITVYKFLLKYQEKYFGYYHNEYEYSIKKLNRINEEDLRPMRIGNSNMYEISTGFHSYSKNCKLAAILSYEIAEKEKYDFVSGQFIQCRKSFNEFKENNSYWLEYVGNDTYVGRSDNILNKKFHITPRQLYRLFTQEHCLKENNANEETNAPTAYGKYVDECLNEASKHFFSEGEDKYSLADLFYAGVRCGQSLLEKQKPVEWSEKDGKMLNSIIDDVMPFGECPDYPNEEERKYYYEGQKKVEWLESLRSKIKP